MTTQITASMIKQLRDRTSVGMAKCKAALEKTNGNIDDAVDYLRKSGMASAVKKEGRETKEGMIVCAESTQHLSLVEINAETDFVVKNELFQKFAEAVAKEVANTTPSDVATLTKQPLSTDPSMTIDGYRASVVQSLGENLQIKRLMSIAKEDNVSLGFYSHMGGKIVSLAVISGSNEEKAFAKDIAMHVAAEAPEFLSEEDVPDSVREKEKDIAKSQALSSGKPEHIIGKIVEGKLKAYFNQNCLLFQKYIKDSDLTITQLIEKRAKESGKPLAVKSFIRWKVGS